MMEDSAAFFLEYNSNNYITTAFFKASCNTKMKHDTILMAVRFHQSREIKESLAVLWCITMMIMKDVCRAWQEAQEMITSEVHRCVI